MLRCLRVRVLALALLCLLAAAPAASAATPQIRHVWVIVLENESASTTFAANSPAHFLAHDLPAAGAYIPNYFGVGHASLDNYIAMISGQAPNPDTQGDCQMYTDFVPGLAGPNGQAVGVGCVYPSSVKTVADQLQAKGLGWKGYMQDMGNDPAREPATCGHPALNSSDGTQQATAKDSYAARHDPFVYFHSIIDSSVCKQRVVPLTALPADLSSEATTPAFSFITPSLCEDGHDSPCADGRPGGLVSADAFLRTWIPPITGSPAYADGGLVIVTFDESDTSDASSCCGEMPGPNSPLPGIGGAGGGRVGAVMLSPFIKPGTVSSKSYNHYSLLRSIEDDFGLSHLGFAAASGPVSFGADVFTQPLGPPGGTSPLVLQGGSPTGGSGGPGGNGSSPGSGGSKIVGCRAARLSRPRHGKYRRGALIAAARLTRSKGRPTLRLQLTHLARVALRGRGFKGDWKLHACRLYPVSLPPGAKRVTLVAKAKGGSERRVVALR